MSTESFTVEAQSTAPIESVFAVLSDGPHWRDWAGPTVRRSSWEREGDPAPGGVGAIRRVGAPPLFAREQIVEYEPPTRLVYVLLSGMPVRDYRAEVVLAPGRDGGTTIRWSASMAPLIPGTGPLVRAVMHGIVGGLARRLARHAGDLR